MNKINLSYRLGRIGCMFFLWLLGPLKAYNVENVPDEGPVCLMPNHISFLDPPITGIYLKRKVYFMAKAELFKIPVFDSLIRSFGAFPVKRGIVDRRAMIKAMELMKSGEVVNIFPEGRRSKDGKIGSVNKGSFDLAFKSNAKIIPVLIKGSENSLSTLKPGLHKSPLKVIYGKALDTEKYKDLPKDELLNNLVDDWYKTIENLREELKEK